MYEMQSFRSSVNEQLTSAGEETLRVLEKQHQYLYNDVSKLTHVRVFVTHRLQAASQVLCDLFQREMDELHTLLEHYNTLLLELSKTTADQCVESSLQVKMSSPVPSRSVSVKQEPEDHLYLNFANLPKDDVSPELQERRPSLVQEEPEPPQINDKREELLQRQEEEAAGSTMTLLAMKSEEGGENREAEPLASTSTGHMKTQADVEGCGALQPTSDDQFLHSHRYASDTEYSDEWEETREDQSGQSYYLSNELSQDPMSAAQQIPSLGCHTGETPVSCTVCGKQFAFGGRLMRHMRTHTGERPFSCTVCGKSFSQSEILKRHEKIHTDGKIFNCPVCGKSFNRTGNLKTHMRIHTGEKPFHCTVCGKRFTLKGHLKTHMRIHTGEKPFTCPVCFKGFVQKIGLERHMGHHTGDYRFL